MKVDRKKGTGNLPAVLPEWISSDVCLCGCVVSTALHDGKPEAWRQLLEATNTAAVRFDKVQWQDDRQHTCSLNVDVRNMCFRDLETYILFK